MVEFVDTDKDILFKRVRIIKLPIGNKKQTDEQFILGRIGLVTHVFEKDLIEVAFFHGGFKDTVTRTFSRDAVDLFDETVHQQMKD